ncbi:MAG: hypothetical protein HGB33_09820, partial [Syntrophaceae bacterium]|nr:hypothetical protein [Syntrophaceae bacterium]
MHKNQFPGLYKELLTPSKAICEKEFIHSAYSYGDIFELAAGISKTLSRHSGGKTLCLCTENKALVAAGVLAALNGACRLILPYSLSNNALMEMREAADFNAAIADHPEEMPAGVEIIEPSRVSPAAGAPETVRDPDEPFLSLFTGGSTGKPRVWSKSPRNLLAEAFYLK